MISVVIPAYNHQKYIADAIRSCLFDSAVTEILIADDGSSDGTLQIIERFAESFPGKIRNLTDTPPKNIGAHNRINQLCAEAVNEWIAILNSDDSFAPGRFRNFAQFAKATRADVIFGNCVIVDSDSRELGKKAAFYDAEFNYPPEWSTDIIVSNVDYFITLLNQNFIATTSNLVIRKDFYTKLSGFQAYRYIHDWDFILRATLNGNVVYSPSMWCNYRIHSGNTISESSHRVKDEARRMFDRLISTQEFETYVGRHRLSTKVNIALSGNLYLSDNARLALVLNDHPHAKSVETFLKVFPGSNVFASFTDIGDEVDYIYAPSSVANMMSEHELRNLFVASAMGGYDFFVLSTTLNHHTVSNSALRDISFIKRSCAARILSGDYRSDAIGRVVRLPCQTDRPNVPIADIFKNAVVRQVGQELFVYREPAQPLDDRHRPFDFGQRVSPSRLAALSKSDERPVVFVMPSVLAVGGAENVLIEIMRQTNDQFAYVVICTDVILETQGSWMTRVLEQCEAVYDIAEACHEATRMAALAWLKALYQPRALLITNGSMWQMKNASGMRRLFKDCAIIDHQCYDDRFGWIEWFNHPGVLASDAFIAVNSRIKDVFLNKVGIAQEKVSLIYHPIDSARIESNLSGLNREQAFVRFGLNADQPVVAYVGRLADQKRPQIFLEVAKIAQDRGDKAQFVMVGQGHLSDVIAQQVDSLQLRNISRVENIPLLEEFYIIVDALMITSEYEGVPLAMLEAMSVGVSVVSTDAGDIGRVISDYQGSQVVPVNATPLVLYDHLMTVLENADGVRSRSKESSARVRESFSGKTIGSLYRQVITAAVKKYETVRPF